MKRQNLKGELDFGSLPPVRWKLAMEILDFISNTPVYRNSPFGNIKLDLQ